MKSPSVHSRVLGSRTPYSSSLVMACTAPQCAVRTAAVAAKLRVTKPCLPSSRAAHLWLYHVHHSLYTLHPLQSPHQDPPGSGLATTTGTNHHQAVAQHRNLVQLQYLKGGGATKRRENTSRSRRAYEGEVEQWAVERELDLCLDQLKTMHGLIFQGAKCENYPKGNLECTYVRERRAHY